MRHYPHSIDLVREFHETFGHPVSKELTAATVAQRRLRVALIAEELGELAVALGVPFELTVSIAGGDGKGLKAHQWTAPDALCFADGAVDLKEAADALADLDYVVQGSNLVFGFPAGALVKEVHDSNMSKLGADGKPIWNEMGKVVKGPNYRKPNIRKILENFDPVTEL